MTMAYLYKWTHIPTNKWYIGSRTRKNCHPTDGYICSSKIVKPLILEDKSNWYRTVLIVGDPLYIRNLETKLLCSLNAADNEMSYNQNNSNGKFYFTGRTHSESAKQKIAEKNTGSNNPNFGKPSPKKNIPASEKTRLAISIGNRGKKRSEEVKQEMAIRNIGENNPNYGTNWTEERRKKFIETRKMKKDLDPSYGAKSENGRAQISRSRKGKKLSDATREKMSKSKMGHLSSRKGAITPYETRLKLSAALKGRIISKESIEKRTATRARNKALKQHIELQDTSISVLNEQFNTL